MPTTGPHLAAALICERVITEGDGVLTIVRVIDRLMQSATGIDPPEQMPPLRVNNLQMVIALKSDRARGRYTIKLAIEEPGGTRDPVAEQDINLRPGNAGINLIIGMDLGLNREGVYWIDVILGGPHEQPDELLTRVPLEVVYQRQRVPPSPGQPH